MPQPGTEAAWQLAGRGFRVALYEMRPVQTTDAHQTDRFAELVFPLLPLKAQPRSVDPASVNTGPFGETIANEKLPLRRQTAQS